MTLRSSLCNRRLERVKRDTLWWFVHSVWGIWELTLPLLYEARTLKLAPFLHNLPLALVPSHWMLAPVDCKKSDGLGRWWVVQEDSSTRPLPRFSGSLPYAPIPFALSRPQIFPGESSVTGRRHNTHPHGQTDIRSVALGSSHRYGGCSFRYHIQDIDQITGVKHKLVP